MIRGFILFVIRIILLNPMVLIGGGVAFYLMTEFPLHTALAYAKSVQLYGIAYAIALVYALLFKHEYYENSKRINWKATFKGSFNEFFYIIISAVLVGIIIYCLQVADIKVLDDYLRNK